MALQKATTSVLKDDIVYVEGYARCRFRVKAVDPKKDSPYHLVYAAVNGEKECEFGWCTLDELLVDKGE
jgi:hypothetical protein